MNVARLENYFVYVYVYDSGLLKVRCFTNRNYILYDVGGLQWRCSAAIQFNTNTQATDPECGLCGQWNSGMYKRVHI